MVDLDRVVAGKISPGGTAPERVNEQLALAREVLSRMQQVRPGPARLWHGRPRTRPVGRLATMGS